MKSTLVNPSPNDQRGQLRNHFRQCFVKLIQDFELEEGLLIAETSLQLLWGYSFPSRERGAHIFLTEAEGCFRLLWLMASYQKRFNQPLFVECEQHLQIETLACSNGLKELYRPAYVFNIETFWKKLSSLMVRGERCGDYQPISLDPERRHGLNVVHAVTRGDIEMVRAMDAMILLLEWEKSFVERVLTALKQRR